VVRNLDHLFDWSEASRARIALTNAYEPIQPYILLELAREMNCSHFIDVGANIGYYSVLFAAEEAIEVVHAYEPMQAAHEETIRNAALNGLSKKVIVEKLALSSASGKVDIAVINELSGANSIICTTIHHDKPATRIESVRTSTLDNELPLRGLRIAIKIDVEGHEPEVLEGGTSLLQENTCIIQVESYDDEAAKNRTVGALNGLGYRKILRVGPDYYFTNCPELSENSVAAIERALGEYIRDRRRHPARRNSDPVRKRVFKGVTVEFSPRLVKLICRTLRIR